MTRREELQERYEDALFALMMDEVATAEGKKALEENERLKNDPEAAVPEEVSRRCRKTIQRHFAQQRAKAVGRFTVKALKNVALVAGICSILFTAAFAASEPLRVNTMNLVVQVFGESTDFYFASGGPSSTYTVVAGWLPDGYTLESRLEDNTGSTYYYQKSENEYLYIIYTRGDGSLISIDTENAKTKDVEILGLQALFTEKENERQIAWGTSDKMAFIHLIASNVTEADLVRIAEKLKY